MNNQVGKGQGEVEPPKLRRKDIEKLLELMDKLIVALDEHYPRSGKGLPAKLHTGDYTKWERQWDSD